MRKIKQDFSVFQNRVAVWLLMFFITIGMSGCEPLRKKFVREKKKDKNSTEFIPVLSPIDYAQKSVSPEKKYRYHYGLWQVWIRDYLTIIQKKGSDKREKYLLDQIILQTMEMQKWVSKTQSQGLVKILDKLNQAKETYKKPRLVRNISRLKIKINSVEKMMRRQFSPKIIFLEIK